MPSTNCSVLGCKSKERKHVFPQNDDDFNMWLQRRNNDKLFYLEKSVVRRRYAVCHLHFDRSCYNPGTKKLKKKGPYQLYFYQVTMQNPIIQLHGCIYMHVYVPV